MPAARDFWQDDKLDTGNDAVAASDTLWVHLTFDVSA